MSDASEEELRGRLARGSQDPDDYHELADLLGATSRPEESLEVLRRALDLVLPTLERARFCVELGWGLYEMVPEGVGQALPLAREVMALLAGQPETRESLCVRGAAQCLLAYCLWWSDEPAGVEAARLAVTVLEQAVREGSENEWTLWAHHDAARGYILLQEGENAVAHCQAFLNGDLKEHDQLTGLTLLSEACRLAGRLEEGARAVDEALRLVGTEGQRVPLLYHTRGLIQRAAGRPAEARVSFEQALAALRAQPLLRGDPLWLKAVHGNLGELYYEAGEYERAMSAFQQCLKQYPPDSPEQATILLWLGHCHAGLGDDDEARRCFQAVFDSPASAEEDRQAARREVARHSARRAFVAGQYQTAVGLLEELPGRLPEGDGGRPRTLTFLGHCHYSLGRYDEALGCYQQVLASPLASAEDRVEAEEWADWSTGRLKFEAGRHAEAMEAFDRLIQRYPEEHQHRCKALLWLAACYENIGASGAARQCWQDVLASPRASEADREQARDRLARLR